MKNTLLVVLLMLALVRCNQNNGIKFPTALPTAEPPKPKVDQVRFPPPVVKPDNEVAKDEMVGNDADASAEIKVQDVVLSPPPPNQNVNKQVSDTTKKIIKTGTISFETSDLIKTRRAILKTLESLHGYLSEENQSNDETESREEYNLKIRIPAQNFDRLLDTISAGAEKIDEKNISITDVTTNFIDVKTRLINKKLLENRYTQLLAKATKVSDLLEIENKLTEIRSDIESTQGQLNYMSKQVAYSSLDITFYKKTATEENGNTFGYKLKSSISGGWSSGQNFLFWLISVWPFILILSVLSFLFFRWRRKRRLAKT